MVRLIHINIFTKGQYSSTLETKFWLIFVLIIDVSVTINVFTAKTSKQRPLTFSRSTSGWPFHHALFSLFIIKVFFLNNWWIKHFWIELNWIVLINMFGINFYNRICVLYIEVQAPLLFMKSYFDSADVFTWSLKWFCFFLNFLFLGSVSLFIAPKISWRTKWVQKWTPISNKVVQELYSPLQTS